MLISSLASAASRPNNSGPEDSLEDKGNGNKQSHFSSSANNACLRPVSGTDENSGLDGAGAEAACVPANVCPCNLVPSAVPAGQMVWTTAEGLVASGLVPNQTGGAQRAGWRPVLLLRATLEALA